MTYFSSTSVFSRTSEEWFEILYDDRPICSTPPPFVYNCFLTGAHLLATPIYVISLYSLYLEKTKSFKEYKKLLVYHTICNYLFEFHMSTIMKPVIYLPYIVTRFAGILFFRYINGGVIFLIFCWLIVCTCTTIIHMFYYRMKVLTNSSASSEKMQKVGNVLTKMKMVLTVMIGITSITFVMCTGGLFGQSELKRNLKAAEIYPEIMCASALTIPVGKDSGFKPIHLFNLTAGITCFYGGSVCIMMGSASVVSLRELFLQTTTSRKTMELHRMFLFSLFAQIGVHTGMLGLPLVMYVVSLVFKIDANAIGYAAIVTASLHGTMSTLSMLYFNKPLHASLMVRFGKIFNLSTKTDMLPTQFSIVSRGKMSISVI